MSTKPLTKAQSAALRLLEDKGTIYAYGGVSRSTAAVLVRYGLAAWVTPPHIVHVRGKLGGRGCSQCEWSLKLDTSQATR